jgi:hypothetical protein
MRGVVYTRYFDEVFIFPNIYFDNFDFINAVLFLTILNICFRGLRVPINIPLAICRDLGRKFK